MSALPSNLETSIKEFVETQKVTGLHDVDPIHLELWHLNKKDEVHSLEQEILKPLKRKVRNINNEIAKEEKKFEALAE